MRYVHCDYSHRVTRESAQRILSGVKEAKKNAIVRSEGTWDTAADRQRDISISGMLTLFGKTYFVRGEREKDCNDVCEREDGLRWINDLIMNEQEILAFVNLLMLRFCNPKKSGMDESCSVPYRFAWTYTQTGIGEDLDEVSDIVPECVRDNLHN